MVKLKLCLSVIFFAIFFGVINAQETTRSKINFNKDWTFNLGDVKDVEQETYSDADWRKLSLPHDWSIELPFDSTSPTGVGGGALRGGLGWYRKAFTLSNADKAKKIFIDFDGVYRNSEVFINGHLLGKRPNGYISFEYDLTPYLKFDNQKNLIAVKVDNSQQPNSRWYSGSGIYRNVWLVKKGTVAIDNWGTFITTPIVSNSNAEINIKTTIATTDKTNYKSINVITNIIDNSGKVIATNSYPFVPDMGKKESNQQLKIANPKLWDIENPYLYKAIIQLKANGKILDEYATAFGIRYFNFDVNKGFSLNGKPMKIQGVCNHHDLGCLGTAINYRALQRQLEILKAMGCNGIRTSHNPPAPELLDLCDKMGFIVMDEAFDMWQKEKTKYDYHLDFVQWHKKDLEDQILRDRNHPSVFMWSVGNEVGEQWNANDTSGTRICKELVEIVKSLDTTRPTISALSNPKPFNPLVKANAFDLIGFNYEKNLYASFHDSFPGQKFLGSETVSSEKTRGYYDLFPSDSIRRWPHRWDEKFKDGNHPQTVSSYDNISAPWGNTHEESLKAINKYPYLSGQYIWTGFDYLGEPTPYDNQWPSRSAYMGIIDLAGFPKDVYYMYQSQWTDKTVLHLLPHWNWAVGNTVDVWAYYSNADEVELFLNGKSLGIKKKLNDDLHVMWRVKYEPGILKAISRKDGKIVLTTIIKTAGKPAKIILTADRSIIKADGNDLSYVTATIIDTEGNIVPDADNSITFLTKGEGDVIATDNGCQTSLESFKGNTHKAFNGLCLAVVQSKEKKGQIIVTANGAGLQPTSITLQTK